jgi:hypothetical protein
MAHASGWRAQKRRISDTVAEAAETASLVLIAELCPEAAGVSFAPPLGRSTRTTPNQNAILNKNIMFVALFVLPPNNPLSVRSHSPANYP